MLQLNRRGLKPCICQRNKEILMTNLLETKKTCPNLTLNDLNAVVFFIMKFIYHAATYGSIT